MAAVANRQTDTSGSSQHISVFTPPLADTSVALPSFSSSCRSTATSSTTTNPIQPTGGGPLELIAPGLTEAGLCPLANSNPQAVINAIAQGATAAYNKGGNAPAAYADALGVAVGAAAANGCIDTVFELVNQAIMKGGYPVEVVVGRALAKGTAQGVDSATGEVLAKATAVVICRGGESASACARAWSQAIKMDGNGCLVLVKAYAYAKARCGPGYATSQATSTVYKEALGYCKVDYTPQAYQQPSQPQAYQQPGAYQQAPAPVSVSQGPWGQTINSGGMTIQQGPGGMSIGGVNMFGRKMLAATSTGAASASRASNNRKMLQWGGGYFPSWVGGAQANSNAAAINNGVANGPITANAFSQANGYGGGPASANSNAVAMNNGVANGGVTANAASVAYGH